MIGTISSATFARLHGPVLRQGWEGLEPRRRWPELSGDPTKLRGVVGVDAVTVVYPKIGGPKIKDQEGRKTNLGKSGENSSQDLARPARSPSIDPLPLVVSSRLVDRPASVSSKPSHPRRASGQSVSVALRPCQRRTKTWLSLNRSEAQGCHISLSHAPSAVAIRPPIAHRTSQPRTTPRGERCHRRIAK